MQLDDVYLTYIVTREKRTGLTIQHLDHTVVPQRHFWKSSRVYPNIQETDQETRFNRALRKCRVLSVVFYRHSLLQHRCTRSCTY